MCAKSLRSMLSIVDDLEIVGRDLGKGHCNDIAYRQHHALAATALYLDKNAFLAVERPAMDAHPGATGKVELLGFEIDAIEAAVLRDIDKLAHLLVLDHDGHIAAVLPEGHVLQVGQPCLETLHIALGGMNEEQVVDSRLEHAPRLVAHLLDDIVHGNETLDACIVEQPLCHELTTIGDSHGEPLGSAIVDRHGHFSKLIQPRAQQTQSV